MSHPSTCHPLVDRRPGPGWIDLPRRRDRVIEGLAHRATVRLVTIGKLADRHVTQTVISSDLLEQFHA
jgi:hypothetical protein